MQSLHEIKGRRSVKDTIHDLKQQLDTMKIPVFALFDHAKNAETAGLKLPETSVLVFGSPMAGTKLMQEHPQIAWELPLRILVRADEKGNTWISYKEPDIMAEPYGLHEHQVVQNMCRLLKNLSEHAARDSMLNDGDTIYFVLNAYVMEGNVIHVEGTENDYTFEIDGFSGCGGPHIIASSQLHHTIFLSREEAETYKDNPAVYLAGSC